MEVLFRTARVDWKGDEYVVLVDYLDEDRSTKTHQVLEAKGEVNANIIAEQVIKEFIKLFSTSP